jgi:hypothetical protein
MNMGVEVRMHAVIMHMRMDMNLFSPTVVQGRQPKDYEYDTNQAFKREANWCRNLRF